MADSSLVDRFTAYMLNANDRGPDYIGSPDLMSMQQTPMAPLVPFNGRAPSLIETDITTVPPLAGVAPGGNVLPVQNIEADLRQLRAEMPFLPIISRPQWSRSLFLAANVAQNVDVPTNVSLVRFASSGEFYVNFDGTASVPTANVFDGVIYKPEGVWYYCGGLSQVSIVSPNVNTIVTLEFIGRRQQGG